MTLVILYGPPAVGKLTVGTELAKLTGFKLFHNHLVGNLARDLFDFGSPGYKRLKHELWHATFRIAAEEDLPGMIFTFMYEGARDDSYLAELFAILNEAAIDYQLVRLTCDEDEIKRRLGNESRAQHRKLMDRAKYEVLTATSDFGALAPYEPTITIQTTSTPPAETARLIQEHYQLPSSSEEGYVTEQRD